MMLLKESDFISFFDQFPFSEMFKHILRIGENGTKHGNETKSPLLLLVCIPTGCCRGNSCCRDDELPDATADCILDMPHPVARCCLLNAASG